MTFPEPEFEDLFVAHYDRLVGSLTAIIGDRETARDCVQEAFIKASVRWRRVGRYDNPAAWVLRVAINRSRDLHRADRRRARRESRLVGATVDDPVDQEGLVDGSMRLTALLRQLPERQRTVAALYYVEDMSVADIAGVLRLSTGAVKFHLNRARSALRGVLSEEGQHHG